MFSKTFNPDIISSDQRYSLTIKEEQVLNCLKKEKFTLKDLPILISPAASNHLETLAQKSKQLTTQRFGKTMSLYIPMYLSNECFNTCTYCGFSMENDYPRKTLTDSEILKEGLLIKEKGFQHLLILTGESPRKVGTDYICNAIELLKPYFSSISIEVQPLSYSDYKKVIKAGADGLTLYQETYHPNYYVKYHPRGQKKDFNFRLNALEDGARANFYKINIGALFGLYDWRYETLSIAQHLSYLKKHYWQIKYGISFPRIKEAIGSFSPEFEFTDKDMVHFICAMRLLFPDTHINLSTREPAVLRDHLLKLGITMMSAESHTNPGGYSGEVSEKQFEISDNRTLNEIQHLLTTAGYEPVLKDWD